MSNQDVQVDLNVEALDFPDVMDLRTAALYLDLSEQRTRTLAKEGDIEAWKTESAGHWRFNKEDLDTYKAMPRTRKSGGFRGDRKYWRMQVEHTDLEEVTEFLAETFDIEVEPMYAYERETEAEEEDPAHGTVGEF